MTQPKPITTLFVDIGGVLLNNGWDHKMREEAAKTFNFDKAEMESRHNLAFDTFELGKLTLNEYLAQVLFYKKRPFTRDEFKKFIFSQSKPFPEMIELISKLKARYRLKVVAVNNEGSEINDYRIAKFKLGAFVDFFVSSCFVHLCKPDPDIYKAALSIAQASVDQVIYIEDRPLFVEVATKLGISSILHTDFKTTSQILASYGLSSS